MPMRISFLITLGLLSLIFVDAAPALSQGEATSPRYNLRSGGKRVPKPVTEPVPAQVPSRKPSTKQTIYIILSPNGVPPAESHELEASESDIVTRFLHIKAIWELFELDRYSTSHRPSVHSGPGGEESKDSTLNLVFLKTTTVEAPLTDGVILFFIAGIPQCQDSLPHGCRVEFTLSRDRQTVEAYIITIQRPGEVRIILAQHPSPHQSAEESAPRIILPNV